MSAVDSTVYGYDHSYACLIWATRPRSSPGRAPGSAAVFVQVRRRRMLI